MEKIEFLKITMTKSCPMVGTQKPKKNSLKILVSSAPNRGPKCRSIRFLREKCLFSCSNFRNVSEICLEKSKFFTRIRDTQISNQIDAAGAMGKIIGRFFRIQPTPK